MKIGNREFDVTNRTYIMGILNVTPDSFSDVLEAHQMTLFDAVNENEIIKEIQELNLGEMTPIEGLNYLFKLQNQLKNRW